MRPDNLDLVEFNVRGDDMSQAETIRDRVVSEFDTPVDFLGLYDILNSKDESVVNTLWWQTLYQNGYYASDGSVDKSVENLITYVNLQTKKFILDLGDSINYISDENLIKLISLRASIALAQRGSEYGNWLYPNSLNYQEFSMNDVLMASVISQTDLYYQTNLSLTKYVNEHYGWLSQIMLLIVVAFSYIIVNIMNIAIPVLYIGMYLIFMLRFVVSDSAVRVIRGYAKVSLILFILYSIFCFSFVIAGLMAGTAFGLFILLIMQILVGVFMVRLIISLLSNILDFGDRSVMVDMRSALDKLTFGLTAAAALQIANMRANHISNKNSTTNVNTSNYNVYAMNTDLNQMYAPAGGTNRLPTSKGNMRFVNNVGDSVNVSEFYSGANLND
jgi:hypothetical protein